MRKGVGSDAAAGTSAATAWLTIGKALNFGGMASGDTLYVGAGVYRELLSVSVFSPSAATRIIADTTGQYTGDAGIVRVTDYLTNDKTAPSGTQALLNIQGRDWMQFYRILFHAGGSRYLVDAGTNKVSKEMVFEDCTFVSTAYSASHVVYFQGDQASDTNIRFNRCRFFWTGSGNALQLGIVVPSSGAVVDADADVGVTNCFFHGTGGNSDTSQGNAIRIDNIADEGGVIIESGGATPPDAPDVSDLAPAPGEQTLGAGDKSGGVRAVNCTAIVGGSFMSIGSLGSSAIVPCEAYNNVMVCSQTALHATVSGQIVEANNHIVATTPRTNVTAGSGSVSNGSRALLVDVGHEEYRGDVVRPFFTPRPDSPYLGWGSTSPSAGITLPTTDLSSRPKPSGGGPVNSSASNAIGCHERHDFAAKETTTTDSAPAAFSLRGPGDVELLLPVEAAATVVTVRVRWDGTYAGSLPQAVLLDAGEIGVSTQTLTAVGSSGTWYTLTFSSFTPTARGWVTVRLLSRSTAGTGMTYFDTVTIT